MSEGFLKAANRIFGSTLWTALLVLVLASSIYLPLLGSRPLLGSDEPRVAAIAAEMERYDDWVEPMLNGKPFLEIPPMHWWLSAGAFKLFGESVAIAKLPSALAAVSAVLFAFGMARMFGLSNFISFLCAMMLATAPEFWIIGRRCIMDTTMCAFVALALFAFPAFIREGQAVSRRWLWLAVFYVGLSGALMSKGVIGLGIPCSGIFVWLLFRRERSLAVWAGFLGTAALSFIPMSVWLFELYRADGFHAVKTIVWTNNIGRFTGGHAEHVEPFYYYLSKFPAQFLPWTLAFAGGLFLLFTGRLKGEARDGAIYGALCFAVPFIVLCVAAGKRSIYLLPLYPVAALLSACAVKWCVERLRDDSSRLKLQAGAIGLFLLYSLSLLAADVIIHPLSSKYGSAEPAFVRCSELLSSGRRMIIHSRQERILGGAVFYLGRRFQVAEGTEDVKDILEADPNAFAIADESSFDDMDGGVRLIDRFETGRKACIAIFDIAKPEGK